MAKKRFTPALLLSSLLLPVISNAQEVEMADTMRSEGKIYVVVVVAFFVLAVLSTYLISIDRRLRRMEKKSSS
jgi:uncharacterized membrane protein YdbT with pleckstrin-like domain